jgi:hypothetical protein
MFQRGNNRQRGLDKAMVNRRIKVVKRVDRQAQATSGSHRQSTGPTTDSKANEVPLVTQWIRDLRRRRLEEAARAQRLLGSLG